MQELAISLNSHLVACQLKLEQYERPKFHCDLALRFDPNNMKLRYQRAQAFLGMILVDDVSTDLETTLKFVPKNHTMLKESRKLEEGFVSKSEVSVQVVANMMN